MLIDHIFISSKSQGEEANRLVESRFLEGSNRVHPEQGTRNRKFYFDNFFLEIVWENNSKELESELIRNTGLLERVRFEQLGYSRFGLGLNNTDDSDLIFRNCEFYQPSYFPVGNRFEILPNHQNPFLPWTFRGPLKGRKKTYDEPLQHPNGARMLSKANFQIPESELNSDFVKKFQGHPQIYFEQGEKPGLVLEMDEGIQGLSFDFPELDLKINF